MRFDTAERDRKVAQIIRDSMRDRGHPPTVSEVAAELGVHKTSAQRALARLQRDGVIEVAPNNPGRGIKLRGANTKAIVEEL